MIKLVTSQDSYKHLEEITVVKLDDKSVGHRIIAFSESAMLDGDEIAAYFLVELAFDIFDNAL